MKKKINKTINKAQEFFKTDIRYLIKGGFWKTTSQIIVLLISFATMKTFSSWLPKKTYGIYQYINSIIAILAVFTLPGIQTALVRAIARKKEGSFKKSIKEKAKWSLLGVLASLLISGWYFFKQNLILGKSFLIASFLFPIPRIANLSFSFWQGRRDFKKYSKLSILTNSLEALFFIPVLFLTDNIVLIMLAYFLSRSVFRFILLLQTQKETKNEEVSREAVSFGKHLTLMQVIGLITNQLDIIIIWQFLGPIQVAIYSFAKKPIQKAKSIVNPSFLIIPKLSQKNIKEIKKELTNKFFKSFLFFIPLTIVSVLALPFAFKIVFPQYISAIPYAQAFCLSFLSMPFSLISSSFYAEAQTKELYSINIFGSVFKIVFFLVLIPLFGIWGIIISILLTQLLSSLYSFYLFQKI